MSVYRFWIMTYCQRSDAANIRVRVTRPRHRSVPSVRRRVVNTTGRAATRPSHRPYIGNARGQNPVHLHSSKGGAPERVCRRGSTV